MRMIKKAVERKITMKTQMHKRFLAMLMTLVMLVSIVGMIPLQVSAAAPQNYTNIYVGIRKYVSIPYSNGAVYFRFVPEQSGNYSFSSSNRSGDPKAYLLDSNGNELTSNDDGNGNYNFIITYNLTADTVYYLKAAMYGINTGSYYVNLTCNYVVEDPEPTEPAPTEPVSNVVEIAEGTNTYSLFNSGRTGSCNGQYNPNSTTHNNNGYDLLASLGGQERIRLGKSFVVNANITEQAMLNINAWDVDEDYKECSTNGYEYDYIDLVDETTGTIVRLDGHMSGQTNTWNNSIFRIDPSLLQTGHSYHFELYMTCTGSSSCTYYAVWVRTVSLEVNGQGGAIPESGIAEADLTASISSGGLVSASLSASAYVTENYTLEYKAVHASTGQQRGGKEYSVEISTDLATFDTTFQLESNSPSGTYIITVFIKDSDGNVVTTRDVTVGWEKFAVTYNANGGTQNLPLDTQEYASGDTVTVRFDYVPSKSGYVFLGWATSSSATQPDYTENGINTFTIGADDVTLYAVWEEEWDDTWPSEPMASEPSEPTEPIATEPSAPTEPVDADVWDGTASSGFGGGTGSQSNPYLIYTAEQLAYLAQSTNAGTSYSGKYFKLMNNLDLNNREWTPIGYDDACSFKGNFDGNYHTIHNLKLTGNREFAGLFGCVQDSIITRLGIVDGYIDTYYHDWVANSGMLCAQAENTTVSYCFVTGEVQTTSNRIENSHCVKAGMILGNIDGVTLQNCYACGTVYGEMTQAWNTYIGGLAGVVDTSADTCRVSNCYFIGTIQSDGYETSYAGGVLGIGSVNITNCYVAGSITAYDSYNMGAFCANSPFGTPSVSNSYYDLEANKSFTVSQGAYRSRDSFKSQSWITSYLGWDFTNIWTYREGYDYPVLRGFGVMDPHVHSYTATVVPATCEAEGYTQYTCDCGDSYQDHITARLPHIPGAWIVDQAATCTQAGSKHTSCTECSHTLDNIYEPALGHNYTAVITKAPTCTQPGINTFTCSRCGHSYNEYIYSEHNYSITAQQAPTCETDGYTTYTCANCGDTYQEIIPGEHDYVAEITKVATAESDGEVTYTCSICGDYYVEVIPARPDAKVLLVQDRLPWNENNNVSLLNKMVEDGYLVGWDMTTTANLSVANLAGYGVVLIANDQTTATYNQLGAAQEALLQFADAGGVVIYGACDHGWAAGDIGYTLPEGVTKDNYYSYHNYIVDASHPIVTGTYTDGKALSNTLLQGTYCSHTAFFNLPADANVILQDGHGDPTLVEYGYGDGHIILSGLTWEFYYVRGFNGNTTYTKNVYDDLVFYALQLSDSCDHAFDAGEVIVPTCEEKGYTLHTCALCGITMKDRFVDATGHTAGEWETVREATQTATGLKELRCTVCNQLLDEEILPMIDAPVVSVIAQTNPVIVGQTFEVYVVIQDCDDVLSAAFVPEYDSDVFELIAVQWQKEAVIQTIDPEIMSAWNGLTDINGTLLKLVFKANALTSGSQITTRALVQDNAGLITLSVVGDTVAVITCPHAQFEITSVDSDYHGCVCTICGYTELLAHSYDNTCDTTCNDCDYTREITHQGGEYRHDGTNHWQVCTVCGTDLTAEAHTFDNGCDTTCNVCDYTRQVTHVAGSVTYDDDYHWRNCTVCGEHLNVEAHFYYNSCDRDCNLCGRRRYATHTPGETWESDETEHWKICTVCGDVVETHVHEYDNNEDRLCNDCGYCRVLRGDVNGDGVVNSNDAIHLLYYTFFPDLYPINQSGDMDGNGVVEYGVDAVYLLSYTFFPDEYPLYYPEGN